MDLTILDTPLEGMKPNKVVIELPKTPEVPSNHIDITWVIS